MLFIMFDEYHWISSTQVPSRVLLIEVYLAKGARFGSQGAVSQRSDQIVHLLTQNYTQSSATVQASAQRCSFGNERRGIESKNTSKFNRVVCCFDGALCSEGVSQEETAFEVYNSGWIVRGGKLRANEAVFQWVHRRVWEGGSIKHS